MHVLCLLQMDLAPNYYLIIVSIRGLNYNSRQVSKDFNNIKGVDIEANWGFPEVVYYSFSCSYRA